MVVDLHLVYRICPVLGIPGHLCNCHQMVTTGSSASSFVIALALAFYELGLQFSLIGICCIPQVFIARKSVPKKYQAEY